MKLCIVVVQFINIFLIANISLLLIITEQYEKYSMCFTHDLVYAMAQLPWVLCHVSIVRHVINAARYALELEAQPIINGGVAKKACSKTFCSPTDHYELFHRWTKLLHMHNQSTAGVIAITPIISPDKIVYGKNSFVSL